MPEMIDAALSRARGLAAEGDDAAARLAYFEVLRLDPRHRLALTELGTLAHAGGFLSAAQAAFRQAVYCHPDYAVGRVGYGDLLHEAGDADAACVQYRAALVTHPEMPRAHQGLA